MVGVVQDGLGGHSCLRDAFSAEWSAGVEVPVPLGEVAAGDLQANPVANPENVGGGVQVYPVLVYLVGCDRLGLSRGLAVARPDDALQYVRRTALRGYYTKFGGEIRVGCRSGG